MWFTAVALDGQTPGHGALPPFHEIASPQDRKRAFFDYLAPIVRAENLEIAEQRSRLLEIAEKRQAGQALDWRDRWQLDDLATLYSLDPSSYEEETLLDELLRRVDVVPRSLVLVQAAKESAWGRSRFARRGNNLFGHACFETDCGLVPARRSPGQAREVRRFASIRESVASYLHNLNTHPSYASLRQIRANARQNGRSLSGVALAAGLTRYSERGERYVREIQNMIRHNNLVLSAAISD